MQDARAGIAIIGGGVVGGAMRQWFATQGVDAGVYDPPKGLRDRGVIGAAEIIFICVPTPYAPGRGFDETALADAIDGITGRGRLVVIKSTVAPGTTDALQRLHPQHRFVFNPEFLREATAVEDMAHPDRQIIGATARSEPDAAMLLALLPPAPFVRVCAAREAEMAKYVANSFLALKVAFANECFDLCERAGIGYDAVREIVAADTRIGGSHFDVFADGYRGYGGKCLPKDSKALLEFAAAAGTDMRVLAAADAVNARLGAKAPPRPARRTRIVANGDRDVTDGRSGLKAA